jgi:uncharacterized protein
MTQRLDLPNAWRLEVLAILGQHLPGARASVFGSRVLGRARPYSDLDVAVEVEPAPDWRTWARLKEAFEASDLPICVDVVDWHRTSADFKRLVDQQGRLPIGHTTPSVVD